MFNRIRLSELVNKVPYESGYREVQELLFNRKTFRLDEKRIILRQLNISSDDFVLWDYDYLPLFSISLADTQRDYLISSNRKDCKKILNMELNDTELEFYFRKDLELSEIKDFWWQHYEKIVKQKAVEWCNHYSIAYEDDMPDVKPTEMVS